MGRCNYLVSAGSGRGFLGAIQWKHPRFSYKVHWALIDRPVKEIQYAKSSNTYSQDWSETRSMKGPEANLLPIQSMRGQNRQEKTGFMHSSEKRRAGIR
ncbi:unnamed protein product [Dovyalis caffra]|uniref:Uncharacterized protein n=1 Tax=Dovyalis caffra TaxID=77055 RepID=A0AAV1S936_9ROSI|nr:unnamed protein product [Dovyalis caffra]